jgi:hypothetical protein
MGALAACAGIAYMIKHSRFWSQTMNNPAQPSQRRLNWPSISTVLSAAILIGAEVFGAAYAGGWALANLFGLEYYLGEYAVITVQVIFCAAGIYVMVVFIREAMRVEPFVIRQ